MYNKACLSKETSVYPPSTQPTAMSKYWRANHNDDKTKLISSSVI